MGLHEPGDFGLRLKQYRMSRNMTQGDLGRLLGLSQETITNYERGGRFPRPRALQAIALRLGLSYDELLGPHEPGAAVSAAAAGPALAVSAEETDFNKHALPDALDLSIERFLEVARREPIEEIFAYSSAWKRARGSSLAQHYHTALMPLLARIGLEWQKGALSVADEHLISHRLREVAVLHARAERPSAAAHSRKARRWMGLCAPGEQHDLALFMHSLALRQAGWSTLYLATQVPISDLLGAIREYRPQVLGISVTMAENVEGLRLYARQVREVFTQDPAGRPAMIAGGQGLSRVEDSLAEEVDAISVSLVEGIELAEGFVHSE
jgi:transcriptional regulator with XRE-family HTH domain